jgi:hypothetical protein
MIGWDLDLDKRLVSLSTKNLNKTIFAFFAVDLTQGITLPVLQALASRASRAAMLCPHMAAFTRDLFGGMTFYKGDRGKKRMLSAGAKHEVLMWRAYLVQLMWDPLKFARSMESFRSRPADILLEFDASLTGFGVQVSRHEADGWRALAHVGTEHDFGEVNGELYSGRQNLCEYMAVMLGLLLLRQVGLRDFVFDCRGDSMTSLNWVKEGRVRSGAARKAALGMNLLLAHLGAVVGAVVHIPGTQNEAMDGLSRGLSSSQAGLPPQERRFLAEGGWAWRFLRAHSPEESQNGNEENEVFGDMALNLVEMLRTAPAADCVGAVASIIV